MSLLVKEDVMNRLLPTPGMVDAICVFVTDIGKHMTKGQYAKTRHQIVICWEIEEKIPTGEYSGKPFMVSQHYTFTLWEKGNLSKMLESWFSKKIPEETRKTGFDLDTLVGKKCTLNLILSEDEKYINVGAVLPARPENKMAIVCTILPQWIQKKIDTQIKDEDISQENNNEDLPF